MKKFSLLAFLLVLLIPFGVFAATTPNVKTLNAKATGSTVEYSGTMEDGSYAVMCKLYSADDEEIDLLSSAVEDGKFAGSFEDVPKGTYNVMCANYEGGDIKSVEVEVTETKTPNTYDAGIKKSIILLIVAVVGIVSTGVILKKKARNS